VRYQYAEKDAAEKKREEVDVELEKRASV
jgi:hypothetical protein